MKLTIKNLKWGAIAAFAGLAGTAHAGPMTWVDTITRTPAPLLQAGQALTYTHILDNFNAATDTVSNYTLALNLYDDRDLQAEAAFVTQGLFNLLVGTVFFDLSGTETLGLTAWGELQLETTGTLTVTIRSLAGDFYVGGSTLTVNGNRNSVPEPGTLALFGASLLGLGLARRRRQNAAA